MAFSPMFPLALFLTQWVTVAKAAAALSRGFWPAEAFRQQAAFAEEMNRQATRLLGGTPSPKAEPAPPRAELPQSGLPQSGLPQSGPAAAVVQPPGAEAPAAAQPAPQPAAPRRTAQRRKAAAPQPRASVSEKRGLKKHGSKKQGADASH